MDVGVDSDGVAQVADVDREQGDAGDRAVGRARVHRGAACADADRGPRVDVPEGLDEPADHGDGEVVGLTRRGGVGDGRAALAHGRGEGGEWVHGSEQPEEQRKRGTRGNPANGGVRPFTSSLSGRPRGTYAVLHGRTKQTGGQRSTANHLSVVPMSTWLVV